MLWKLLRRKAALPLQFYANSSAINDGEERSFCLLCIPSLSEDAVRLEEGDVPRCQKQIDRQWCGEIVGASPYTQATDFNKLYTLLDEASAQTGHPRK